MPNACNPMPNACNPMPNALLLYDMDHDICMRMAYVLCMASHALDMLGVAKPPSLPIPCLDMGYHLKYPLIYIPIIFIVL
jgi:hypothetical protein